MKTVTLSQFYGGVSEDPRKPSSVEFALNKHFNIHKNPFRLSPQFSRTDGSTGGASIANFVYGSDTLLYGLGLHTGSKVKIYQANDYQNFTTWSASTTAEASSGTRNTAAFIEYKSKLYGLHNSGQYVWSYDPATDTFTDNAFDAGESATIITNGIIGTNDNLYFPRGASTTLTPAGAYLIQYDGSTWSNAALVLPVGEHVTGLANWGSYLGVLTSTISSGVGTNARSRLYLWDFVSEDPTEVIELGNINARVLANLEGSLVILNINYNASASEETVLQVYQYTGGTPQIVRSIPVPKGSTLPTFKQVANGKVYFAIDDGDTTNRKYHGIWSFGRNSNSYPYSLSQEFESVTYNTSEYGTHNAFLLINDVAWIGQDNSNFRVNYSSLDTYLNTSFVETQKYRDYPLSQLEAVRINYTPLPSGATVTLAYRKDEETSYTTILTDTVTSSMGRNTKVLIPTGRTLPDFKEIQFKISCTGGASPTRLSFDYSEKAPIYG